MMRWLCNTSAITADTSWGEFFSASSGAYGAVTKRYYSDLASSVPKMQSAPASVSAWTNPFKLWSFFHYAESYTISLLRYHAKLATFSNKPG